MALALGGGQLQEQEACCNVALTCDRDAWPPDDPDERGKLLLMGVAISSSTKADACSTWASFPTSRRSSPRFRKRQTLLVLATFDRHQRHLAKTFSATGEDRSPPADRRRPRRSRSNVVSHSDQ